MKQLTFVFFVNDRLFLYFVITNIYFVVNNNIVSHFAPWVGQNGMNDTFLKNNFFEISIFFNKVIL